MLYTLCIHYRLITIRKNVSIVHSFIRGTMESHRLQLRYTFDKHEVGNRNGPSGNYLVALWIVCLGTVQES